MIRVLSVFGTRPEAIKMAPVVQALQRDKQFESLICVSAQHRAMLDQVLSIFELKADYDLDLMTAGQSPADVTARVLQSLPPLLRQIRLLLLARQSHGDMRIQSIPTRQIAPIKNRSKPRWGTRLSSEGRSA